MKVQSMTSGSILPQLLKFAIPFLFASLLQALYGAADLLIVGRFADSAGVSAVSTGSQVMQALTGAVIGLTTGSTVVIGQYVGARKERALQETIGTSLSVFAILSVILLGIMLFCTDPITRAMQAPAEAVEATRQYIFICSCGILFIIGYNAVSAIFRGLGDSRSPLIFVGVACLLNIAGDLLLVGGFGMGAAGAAIATTVSQGLSLGLAIFFLIRGRYLPPLTRRTFRIDGKKASRIFRLGLPIALQDALVNVSFLIILAIINAMGLTASAAVGVVEKIIVFAFLVPTSFANAIAAMTAQNMGARKPDRARKVLILGILCSLVFSVAFFIYCQFAGTTLTGLFSKDIAVVESGALYLKSYSIDCMLVCFVFCLNAFFSGCGHSLFSMLHSLAATFLLRIPVAYLFSKTLWATLYEIGLAAPAASLLSIVICLIYMKTGRWKSSSLLEETH